MTIKVAVFGAAGRMGVEVCRSVEADPELELVAAVDPAQVGIPLRQLAGDGVPDLTIISAPEDGSGIQVAVDFTVAASAVENIRWCIEQGVHAVVGTTGIPSDTLKELGAAAERTGSSILVAPNFAIGAVLLMRFAEEAARWMPDAEVIELHHTGKADAPSGTALATAERIARGRGTAEGGGADAADRGTDGRGADRPPTTEIVEGARGGLSHGVHVHSVRLPGLVAHQEVILGGTGQTLSIRHDSTDRTSFMPGVVLAVKRVGSLSGLTVGLDELL